MTQNKPPRRKFNGGTMKRLVAMLFRSFPVLVPLTIACAVFVAITSTVPAIILGKVIELIEVWQEVGATGTVEGAALWDLAKAEILPQVMTLLCFYIVAIIAITLESQLMAYITQGFLSKMRRAMYDGMQNLPIRYFDTHKHGDIMSHYTNDIDTLRQLVSQALPTLIRSAVIVTSVFCIMLWYSVWLTVALMVGVAFMLFVSKKIGGGSAKYFLRLQNSVGRQEGFVQEMMNGQKVIKVFNHEKQCESDFAKINEALYEDNFRAHAYANTLGPIIMNIGNVMYVIIAVLGGVLLLANVPNISIKGLLGPNPFAVSILVPFLNMTKQFTGNINQVSQQINSIVMAMAGAQRIFSLMDAEPETDEGYVTLVNAEIDEDGNITETESTPENGHGSIPTATVPSPIPPFAETFA